VLKPKRRLLEKQKGIVQLPQKAVQKIQVTMILVSQIHQKLIPNREEGVPPQNPLRQNLTRKAKKLYALIRLKEEKYHQRLMIKKLRSLLKKTLQKRHLHSNKGEKVLLIHRKLIPNREERIPPQKILHNHLTQIRMRKAEKLYVLIQLKDEKCQQRLMIK